ncbi:MAG: glycosyltransferase family 2 protein [Thermogutta sp.]|nr:glycosyltransferase family 2 protein [Thermogutta sp.]
MLRLSVLIPLAGRISYLEDTLLSVLEAQPEGCRVIVVLDEPYADPWELKHELRFIEAGRGCSVGRAIALGLAEVETPVTFILPCGHEVQPNWADRALEIFADDRVAAVVPVVVRHDAPGVVAAAGMGYRQDVGRLVPLQAGVACGNTMLARRTQVLPHPAGAFFRTDYLREIDVDPELGEEWVLAAVGRGLHTAGYLSVLEPSSRVRGRDFSRTVDAYRDARNAEAFFWHWWDGVPSLPAAARHMGQVLGRAVAALSRGEFLAELSGRLSGAGIVTRRTIAQPGQVSHGPHFSVAPASSRTAAQVGLD